MPWRALYGRIMIYGKRACLSICGGQGGGGIGVHCRLLLGAKRWLRFQVAWHGCGDAAFSWEIFYKIFGKFAIAIIQEIVRQNIGGVMGVPSKRTWLAWWKFMPYLKSDLCRYQELIVIKNSVKGLCPMFWHWIFCAAIWFQPCWFYNTRWLSWQRRW